MRTKDKNKKTELAVMLGLIVLLLVTRLLWEATCPVNMFEEPNDPKEYVKLAINFSYHGVYGDGTTPGFFWPPFWSFFLSNLYSLGVDVNDKTILYILQALFVLILWGIMRQMGLSMLQAVIVVLFYILNPSQILLSNQFFTEHLFLCLFNGALFLVFQNARDGADHLVKDSASPALPKRPPLIVTPKNVLYAVMAGILMGCAALTRGVVFPLLVFFLLLALVMIKRRHLFLVATKLWIITIIIGLIPVGYWTYRNWEVTDQLVVISANSAENLWLGNNENIHATWLLPQSHFRKQFEGMDLEERHKAWKEAAIEYIKKHPFLTILKSGEKLRRMLNTELYGISHLFNSKVDPGIHIIFKAFNQLMFWAMMTGVVCLLICTFVIPARLPNFWTNHFLKVLLIMVAFWLFLHCVIRAQPRYRCVLEPYLWIMMVTGYAKLLILRREHHKLKKLHSSPGTNDN